MKRGRQRETPAATMKLDGDRLREALNVKALSQNAVARLTKIRQGTLSAIIIGERALSRENLRALGDKLRISADYLLGFPDAPVLRGGVAKPRDLEELLRVQVVNRVAGKAIGDEWMEPILADMIADGSVLLDSVTARVTEELEAVTKWLAHYHRLLVALDALGPDAPREATQFLEAAQDAFPAVDTVAVSARAFQRLAQRVLEDRIVRDYATVIEVRGESVRQALHAIFVELWSQAEPGIITRDDDADIFVAKELAKRGLLSTIELQSVINRSQRRTAQEIS